MKAIFQGRNGLSNSIKNEDDKYSVGYLIDPFREWGFLKPAYNGTTITPTGGWDAYVVGGIKGIAYSNVLLAISDTKMWSINTSTNVATSVHDVPASVYSHIVSYATNISGTLDQDVIWYFYQTSGGRYNGTNYTDGVLNLSGGVYATFIWQGYLMLGHLGSISKFNGTAGDNGTLTSNWFLTGTNWTVRSFFNYYNYLGVVIYNLYSRENQILLLDGSSVTEAVKRISVPEYIFNSFNINNDVFFDTDNGLKTLGDNGLESVNDLTFENPTSIGALTSFRSNTVNIFSGSHNNKIYTSFTDKIIGIGRKDNNNPYIVFYPYIPTGDNITMIKSVDNKLFIGSFTSSGGAQHLQYFSTGNAAATLKYTFKDIGQQVIVKYVKFFFKPLASGDSITLGLDTDYGTSEALGTATFATDGVITSKRFEIKKPCHAFRPTVQWVSGGTSISYVEVEYELTSDI